MCHFSFCRFLFVEKSIEKRSVWIKHISAFYKNVLFQMVSPCCSKKVEKKLKYIKSSPNQEIILIMKITALKCIFSISLKAAKQVCLTPTGVLLGLVCPCSWLISLDGNKKYHQQNINKVWSRGDHVIGTEWDHYTDTRTGTWLQCPLPHQKTIHPSFPWAAPVFIPSCLQHVEDEVVNESCLCISLHSFAVKFCPTNRRRTDVQAH